eukprot:6023733-Lingulodinium_polyedra.AAC.1
MVVRRAPFQQRRADGAQAPPGCRARVNGWGHARFRPGGRSSHVLDRLLERNVEPLTQSRGGQRNLLHPTLEVAIRRGARRIRTALGPGLRPVELGLVAPTPPFQCLRC